MLKPEISVVIPVYNSEKTIDACLKAIYNSTYKNFEVIVVDDCSRDNSVEIAKKYSCRIFKLKKNCGPAIARNVGANKAVSNIIFFVDSDVLLLNDAIEKVINTFKENKDIGAVVGIYAKQPANKGLFKRYMALRKFNDFTSQKSKYFSHITGACSAIKKEIFLEFNGFSARYKGADVEDYEIGHKISKKYKILLNPKIQGKHFNPDFLNCIKNYYKRSKQWFSLFIKRRKFSSGAATKGRGISSLAGFLSIVLLPISFVLFEFIYIASIFFIIFLINNLDFYFLCIKERGFLFMIYAIIVNYILTLPIGLGVSSSIISNIFNLKVDQ